MDDLQITIRKGNSILSFYPYKEWVFFLFTGAWYQISFLSVASIQHPRESPTQVGTPHATTTKWHHSNTTDKNCRKRKQERNGWFFFVFTNPFVFFSTGQLYIWYYRKALAALVLLSWADLWFITSLFVLMAVLLIIFNKGTTFRAPTHLTADCRWCNLF